MPGRVAQHQNDLAIVETENVVVVATGHHHRPIAQHADLGRFVAGQDLVALGHRQIPRQHSLLQLANRFDFVAQLLHHDLSPLGLDRHEGRFHDRSQQEDEIPVLVAGNERVQTVLDKLGDLADFPR